VIREKQNEENAQFAKLVERFQQEEEERQQEMKFASKLHRVRRNKLLLLRPEHQHETAPDTQPQEQHVPHSSDTHAKESGSLVGAPQRRPLLTRVMKRCRTCSTVLVKPDIFAPMKMDFLVNHSALYVRVRVRACQTHRIATNRKRGIDRSNWHAGSV
jgi:hypothetical protein